MPHGYDSISGTWFEDGTDLSAGERQRVGLVRTYLRRAPVIVVDEPISSMNPRAEAAWPTKLRSIVSGRTMQIITQGSTTAHFADLVYALGEGKIARSGAHDRHPGKNRKYAEAWDLRNLQRSTLHVEGGT